MWEVIGVVEGEGEEVGGEVWGVLVDKVGRGEIRR